SRCRGGRGHRVAERGVRTDRRGRRRTEGPEAGRLRRSQHPREGTTGVLQSADEVDRAGQAVTKDCDRQGRTSRDLRHRRGEAMSYPPENYPLTPAGVDDYPVKVGSMLLTLVDPHK